METKGTPPLDPMLAGLVELYRNRNRNINNEKWLAIPDRNLLKCAIELDLDYNEIEGKKVLDIGSRLLREKFSIQAKKQLQAEVFSVNPALKGWIYRKILKFKNPGWQRKSIAATGGKLPFIDNYFDTAISSSEITVFYPEGEQRLQAIKEIIRTLKPGGRLHMAPRGIESISGNPVSVEKVLGEDFVDWLIENNHTLESDGDPKSGGDGPIIIKKNPNQTDK